MFATGTQFIYSQWSQRVKKKNQKAERKEKLNNVWAPTNPKLIFPIKVNIVRNEIFKEKDSAQVTT